MKSKTLEHNSNRLLIVITYQNEQFLAGIFAMSGVAILMLTYLGIAPKILASFMQGRADSPMFSISCYIVGLVVLSYGLSRLYSSFLVSKFAFDKTANKLEVESKRFAKTNKQAFRLSEVTGVEEVFKPQATPELFLWIKKGDQARGEKIPFAKASIGTIISISTSLHILWCEVSEFLKDQPILILDKEWTIEQDESKFRVYSSGDLRAYTVDRSSGYLIYELDGKEIGRYKTKDIKNVETEINPDNSDEDSSDRIVLAMIDGGKIPISVYSYFPSSHAVIVRTLKYGLGMEKYLHISPSFWD
ncbi:MAG: hypothetical protein GPJ35_17415 [Microcystis aeruginosa G11-09]|nr:hypothetical protein [Microcystis aeruginosa G11-09]